MSTFFHLALGNALLVTLLCVPAWFVARVCNRPQICHALWLLLLLKLVCPPLWEVSLPSHGVAAARPATPPPASASAVEAPSSSTDSSVGESGYLVVVETDIVELPQAPTLLQAVAAPPAWRWPRVPAAAVFGLATMWMIGALGWLALALARVWHFERLVRRGGPASASLVQVGHELAQRFGLRECPRLIVARARISPLLWAPGRQPRIVLPAELLERLTPTQQSTLVAHELAHLARGDHRLRWLETLVLAAYWWLPAAWWARRKLSEAEEQCCDALVVARLPERARAYASALLETVEFLADPPVALPAFASGLGTAFPLKRRFEMILTERRGARAPKLVGRLAAAVALVALPLSPLGLRAWAEESAETSVELAVATETTSDDVAADLKPVEAEATVAVELVLDDLATTQLDAKGLESVALARSADLAPPSPDVAARIGKLEATLSGLLAELRALKAANGLASPTVTVEDHVIERAIPDGVVERKVIRVDGKEIRVGGKPTLTLHAAKVDGGDLTIVSPDGRGVIKLGEAGKTGLSRRVIEFRTEGKSRGDVLRKEREALEQRLKEIAAEEQRLHEDGPDEEKPAAR